MVDYQDLLQRLNELKDGAAADAAVEVPTGLLSTTVEGLNDLQAELQNAKDMLMMKPSMAKKLNERIRQLEEELEHLRAKNKVKEMEKRIQNLQAELKASYATKNFTLKNNLLELERKYQDSLKENPELAEMWNDVSQILGDDAKEVTPSYMSRSATFLRVGTMARPRAPLTHGTAPVLDHVPEAGAEHTVGESEQVSAVQAVKQRLEVKIEKASREAAHAAFTGTTPTTAAAEAHKPTAAALLDTKPSEVEEHRVSADAVMEQCSATTVATMEHQASTSGRGRSAVHISDAEPSITITIQEDTVLESLSMLRTMYSNLAQDLVGSQCASSDPATFSKQVQTVQTCIEQLRQTCKSGAVESEAKEFLASIEELRTAYSSGPGANLDQKMEVVVGKVQQLQQSLDSFVENAGSNVGSKSNALPSLDVLRLDSIPDVDLSDAPGVAQADVETLITLFATFVQELAEQHLLPKAPTSPSPRTGATEDGLPSANELVQYFRLYMTTHGASVLCKLLKQQDGNQAAQTLTEAVGAVEPPPSSPRAAWATVSSSPEGAANSDNVSQTAQSSVLPPLSPSAPTPPLPPLSPGAPALLYAVGDGPAPSTEAPSSMGKKTFSAVARAVSMLNSKYKTLLPDNPQTDALFSDLANVLENVIATHELKSQASKQIIARSLKQRSSGPPSVASLGNWDSTGTVGTPTGVQPESPLRSSLQGPGSEGLQTPRAPTSGGKGIALPDATSEEAAAAAQAEADDAAPVDGAEVQEMVEGNVHSTPATAEQGGEQPTLELLNPQMSDKKMNELQNENEYLTRILIDAKVELADTKGEYMALLRALRKALSRENNARSKLDELERVVSVMAPGGPGISALQEDVTLRPIRTRRDSEDSQAPAGNRTGSGQPSRTASIQAGEIQPAS